MLTKLLLSLLPFILTPPPTTNDAEAVSTAAVPPTLAQQLQGPIAVSYNQHSRHEAAFLKRLRGHPESGGQRITREWVQSLPERDARWRFGFTYDELVQVAEALRLPESIVTPSRNRFERFEAFALTCARFRSAGPQFMLSVTYRRQQSAISEVVNWVVTFVDERWRHLLDFDHDGLLAPEKLARYAQAIGNRGAPLSGIWGFIDCTIRGVSRPTEHQRVAYTGHKKIHALKYQAVIAPDGLFVHLYGPVEGRRADGGLLKDSQLLEKCAMYAVRPGSSPTDPPELRHFQLFGDPAYGVSPYLLSPFAGSGGRTQAQLDFNGAMASVRIEVEHGFGIVLNTWEFLRASWKTRLYASPGGHYYRFGVLLTNALNCCRPNQVAQYFECYPPTLHSYFHC